LYRTNWRAPRYRPILVHTIAAHIQDYGTEAQKRRRFVWLASGELLAGTGQSPVAVQTSRRCGTKATQDAGGYVVDGAKTFITNDFTANLLVAARTAARVAVSVAGLED
jgi:acyl-CoA dehydrogenase